MSTPHPPAEARQGSATPLPTLKKSPDIYSEYTEDPHVDLQAQDDVLASSVSPSSLEAAGSWRVAESLNKLRQQIDAAYPGRSMKSDGTIGDTRHQARKSDHNPIISDGAMGVVTAFDITHDPAHQCDAGKIAAVLHAARDPRIKYIIWNRRIANSSPIGAAPAWAWRMYTGSNPHDRHCHVSVKAGKDFYDDASGWPLPLPALSLMEAAPMVDGQQEESTLTDIETALEALGGTGGKPLLQALVEAGDAISVLLSRYAQECNPR